MSVLADRHRRLVLDYFRESPERSASVDDLATAIGNGDDAETARVVVRLHHATLPRLDEVDAFEYDERRRTVRYHGHPELETLLDRVESR